MYIALLSDAVNNAASAPITIDSIAPLISSVTSLGICAWYLVTTTTKTLPTMNELHRQEREKVRADMLSALIEIKNDLKSEIKELRDDLKGK